EGAEKQYRRLDARRPDRFDDADAVEPRQHSVDDDEIVGFAGGKKETVTAVVRMVDDVPPLRQPVDDVAGRLRIIFENEHIHGDLICNWDGSIRRRRANVPRIRASTYRWSADAKGMIRSCWSPQPCRDLTSL